MSKNNSKKRKDERKLDGMIRDKAALYRDCGHWHTENGWLKCPYYNGNRNTA